MKALVAIALMGALGVSNAALYQRSGGMVYDSALNITWIADMNLAKTSDYDSDGLMS
ncbi:hypothetical protein [Ideonella livida]|uniref:Uncharacterized protein n=1 Tax=Ideonella livida TaxID=2707176 RepID=A0A7C9TND3_9BURK|nr:hypothetical protein [Ideonella livida]NDY93365.1 hypothetical protein [Ideonella livida]